MSARSNLSIALILVFLSALSLLTACRNENVPFTVEEEAEATCSETCARYGQCGTLPDNQKAVLANQAGPAVSLHDRYFTEGTRVIVIEISQRDLVASRNGVPLIPDTTPFPHTFYRVNSADKSAWVSEWCLARP